MKASREENRGELCECVCVCEQFGAQFKLPVLRIVWIADSKQLSAISTLLREQTNFFKTGLQKKKKKTGHW